MIQGSQIKALLLPGESRRVPFISCSFWFISCGKEKNLIPFSISPRLQLHCRFSCQLGVFFICWLFLRVFHSPPTSQILVLLIIESLRTSDIVTIIALKIHLMRVDPIQANPVLFFHLWTHNPHPTVETSILMEDHGNRN